MPALFDPPDLWQLRVAATLVAAAPMSARVSDGDRTLLRAMRPPFPDNAEHAVVPTCWFHSMVAHARTGVVLGTGPILDCLLRAGSLRVGLELHHPGEALPGGVWRLDRHCAPLYLVATSLGGERAKEVATGGLPPVAAGGRRALEVGYLEDQATGVTVVSISVPPLRAGQGADAAAVDLALVHDVLARCLAAELIDDIEGWASAGDGAP